MYLDTFIKYLNDRRLVFSVTLLLTVILAYQLSILFWQLMPLPTVPESTVNISSTERTTSSQSTLSAKQKTDEIASQHLFGRVQQNNTRPEPVKDAPKSSLRYKVRGIYYSEDQSLASVIIEKNPKTTQFFRLGDEIDSRIYIEQIQPNYILISRLGKLEKLVLEKPKADLSAKLDSRATSNLPVSDSAKVLQSYKRRYANDPLALAKRFQAVPVMENGRNIGYKLKALRGERLLQKLDIKDDDVFLEINGIGLDKPFQALDALKSLTTAEQVSVTILRNGNRETLNYNLQ